MKYVVNAKDWGLHLKSYVINSDPRLDYFITKCRTDSNYATNLFVRLLVPYISHISELVPCVKNVLTHIETR